MNPSHTSVAVVGGGAVGLTLALRLLSTGRVVTLFDEPQIGLNASGIAAGMLAPLSESLGEDAQTFGWLQAGRDLWTPLAAQIGIAIDRSGAVHLVEHGSGDTRVDALTEIGGQAARAKAPGWLDRLNGLESVWTPDDWRLDVLKSLAALRRTFLAKGGVWRRERWTAASLDREPVVLAGGWGTQALAALAPETRHLSPIKGQILRFTGGPATGPVVRVGGTYLAPDAAGLIAGATMEFGVADDRIEPAQGDRLRAAAASVTSALDGLVSRQQTGVRAATPDGWPLVGPSVREGVWLATGARRNGWLLAPLIAEVLAARFEGDDAGKVGRLFDAQRFG